MQAGDHPHLRKLGLRREPLDRLNQVLVRVAVRGEDLAHERDHREGVLPIDAGNGRRRRGRKGRKGQPGEVGSRRRIHPEARLSPSPHDATHPANSGFVTLPNSMQAKIPPGLRTRYASLRTAGMSVQLRIPKAIV